MNEEGSLFDVPPAAIGRYRVRQPLGAGTTGPAFHAETPDNGVAVAIKLFTLDLSSDTAEEAAHALNLLIDQTPANPILPRPLDAGSDVSGPYFVTTLVDGASLDEALRDFGPAAIEDLVPRLQALAGALDAAHQAGLVHGALHPRDILVGPDTTHLTGVGVWPVLARLGVKAKVRRPYGAPETSTAARITAESDQYSLAAIAFEWLFGRRISGPAERPVDVRALPGVDRGALSRAFTTALSPEPEARFESCRAFCDAIAAAVNGHSKLDTRDLGADLARPRPAATLPDRSVDDLEIGAFPSEYEPEITPPAPEVDEPRFESMAPEPPADVVRIAGSSSPASERFGTGALIATLLVGLVVGFAAGYMAKPRALQRPPSASSPIAIEAPALPERPDPTPAAPNAPAQAPSPAPTKGEPASTASAPQPPAAAPAPTGSLLVRSTPSGASVLVDGVPRGTTPLAVRDLELRTWTVMVAERGFIPDERRVVLTPARPSRSLEVRLQADSQTAAPAAVASSPASRAAVEVGALVVDSRPPGAVVTINGQARGLTPLTLEAMAPGDYTVTLSLRGYKTIATTVLVVAGERARAAASLSAQERE